MLEFPDVYIISPIEILALFNTPSNLPYLPYVGMNWEIELLLLVFTETEKLTVNDVIASYQKAIIDVLVEKVKRALEKTGFDTCIISGGVAANQDFRNEIKVMSMKYKTNVFIPEKEYSTDNGAMVAIAGYYKFKKQEFGNFAITAKARYKLGN